MAYEQLFGKLVDTEHLFVLQCGNSEQLFDKGDAMSVAFELEHEAFYPRLQVVSLPPRRPGRVAPSSAVQRRRVVLALAVLTLLVLLMLPIRALGGKTIAASSPTAGQEYVVRSGDTLASIATQVDPGRLAALVQQLAHEAGSAVVVPGEHLLIP